MCFLRSCGCILAELLTNDPLLPGKGELDQIDKMHQLLGQPDLSQWEEATELPYFKNYNFTKKIPSKLRAAFPKHSYTGQNYLTDCGFDLLTRLLCYNPNDRLTASEALQHPWFNETPRTQDISMMPSFPSGNETAATQR